MVFQLPWIIFEKISASHPSLTGYSSSLLQEKEKKMMFQNKKKELVQLATQSH